MKKSISYVLLCILMLGAYHPTTAKSIANKNDDGLATFQKYLSITIKYPQKAKANHVQGNSLILFSVVTGKLKDLKIQTELGASCDVEVLNSVLGYDNFGQLKSGKYALKATFKLNGSDANMENEHIHIPDGYIALSTTISAYGASKPTGLLITSNLMETANSPMYIINGEQIAAAKLNTLDPNTIENISILKDASATLQYGKDAEHGVIIIKTKDAPMVKMQKHHLPLYVVDDELIEDYGFFDTLDPKNIKSMIIVKDAATMLKYGKGAENGVIFITTKDAPAKKKKTN